MPLAPAPAKSGFGIKAIKQKRHAGQTRMAFLLPQPPQERPQWPYLVVVVLLVVLLELGVLGVVVVVLLVVEPVPPLMEPVPVPDEEPMPLVPAEPLPVALSDGVVPEVEALGVVLVVLDELGEVVDELGGVVVVVVDELDFSDVVDGVVVVVVVVSLVFGVEDFSQALNPRAATRAANSTEYFMTFPLL